MHATHITHASMPPMSPMLAHHSRKHATHASTYSTPFLKLIFYFSNYGRSLMETQCQLYIDIAVAFVSTVTI